MSAITLDDIARRAGVSKSTVSRALRDHPRIGEATRERIKALAKTLNYRPDPLIATWINRRWSRQGAKLEVIAWLTAFRNKTEMQSKSPYVEAVFQGAEERADACGYSLEAFWLRAPNMTPKRMSQILKSRGIRAVCLAPLNKGMSRLNLDWDSFACAAVGYTLIRPEIHRASPHHLQGIELALRALRHSGYRRIGVCIAPDVNRKVNYSWAAGVLLFQSMHSDTSVALSVSIAESDDNEFKEWFLQHRPEVLLGSSGYMGKWLTQMGVSVPITVLAWHQGCAYPGLDQKPFDVGAAAVDLIVGQLQRNETGIPRVPQVTMVHGEWRMDTATLSLPR